MNPIDYWILADELNVMQVTLLILGLDPAQHSEVERQSEQPDGYTAVSTALKNAIKVKGLEASISFYELEEGGREINWEQTLIHSPDLKSWLSSKKFTDNFFFSQSLKLENYLDPSNKYYAPKLSAAVGAWTEVTSNPELLNGKTPKQALEKVLRLNASQYGLTKDDGNPNESAIEEISKIANWNLAGGVAKTPTQVQRNLSTPPSNKKSLNGKKSKEIALTDIEADIPF